MNHSESDPASDPARLPLEPMDPQITSIQPGGGIIVHLELWWGGWRRWCLKTFRPGYVARMRATRRGDPTGVPHDVLDSRDLKFHRNLTDCHWAKEDDSFAWRDRIPFARVGLAELLVLSVFFWGLAIGLPFLIPCCVPCCSMRYILGALAFGSALCGLEIAWFFRNPRRVVPTGPGEVVSPADGKVVHIVEVEHDEFIGGPAVEIGIFLSIFNVHINRTPVAARVIGLRYRRGKFLNALKAESAKENEQLAIRLEETVAPFRRMVLRQITGAIARRIVCWLKPGDELERGAQIGMIKLGSRTELVLPREAGFELLTRVGDAVIAGETVLARYCGSPPSA